VHDRVANLGGVRRLRRACCLASSISGAAALLVAAGVVGSFIGFGGNGGAEPPFLVAPLTRKDRPLTSTPSWRLRRRDAGKHS
jgi:hypothetical protein